MKLCIFLASSDFFGTALLSLDRICFPRSVSDLAWNGPFVPVQLGLCEALSQPLAGLGFASERRVRN